MELETVNKLYLELSQFASAKTANDIALDKQRASNVRRGKLLADIFNCEECESLPVELKRRIDAELMGHNAKVEADSRGFMREVAPRTTGYAGDNKGE